VARSEQNEIQRTLGQYRSAYQRLDAEGAQAVWPSVDVRALARAFDTLSSQELAFETCLFDIAGPVATAQCRGSATYTPKVGGRGPKAERRQWTFHLRKVDEAWKIEMRARLGSRAATLRLTAERIIQRNSRYDAHAVPVGQRQQYVPVEKPSIADVPFETRDRHGRVMPTSCGQQPYRVYADAARVRRSHLADTAEAFDPSPEKFADEGKPI
jgi:hypothetical protein